MLANRKLQTHPLSRPSIEKKVERVMIEIKKKREEHSKDKKHSHAQRA